MPEPIILNNRYRLEERQGSGGMAMVYRAHDLMLERQVAIKILRKDFSSDPEFRERFRQEAKSAANLSHPNIVTVHDFGLDADRLFIVMEYVPGTDLKTILQRRGRLGISDALALMVQACAGVGYAHRAGLVHCDVEPQNMLVTPEKRLKVVDFGIARALASIAPDEKSEVVWGSPQYFAPEQASGGAPSPASDVYSLGVVMFELLTGQLPFNGSTPEDLARLHREAPPPSPRRINPAIPASLEQILLKVLAKEPASRYRTADQLGRVLVTFSNQVWDPDAVATPSFPDTQEVEVGSREPHYAETLPVPSFTPPDAPPYDPNGYEPTYAPGWAEPGDTLSANPNNPVYDMPSAPAGPRIASVAPPRGSSIGFDWFTWLLFLLALIAVVGLFPFFLWVYYNLYPPI